VHQNEDEVVYVIEGAIEVRINDQKLSTVTGGIAHLPKQIPHALYNPMKTTSKYLAMAIPGGIENFFDELEAAQEAGILDKEAHRKISLE